MRRFITGISLQMFCLSVLLVLHGSIKGQVFTSTSKGADLLGDVMHSASGTDFIDVVYSKEGIIYYNRLTAGGSWVEEKSLGTGTEARIAVDNSDHPHIVYITADKVAYTTSNGSEWSTVEYIESNNAGACSKPDIAVDAAGKAHVTYTDTKGNVGDYTDRPDIMYATNSSGSFVKTLIFKGFLDYYGGADRYAEYFDKGSVIEVDNNGNYYILAHKFQYQTWMGGNDKQYSVVVNSNLGTGGTPSYSSDVLAVYDLARYGGAVFALYRESSFKVSELILGGTPPSISFSNTSDVTSSSVSSLALQGTDIVTGGITSGKLFTKHNALAHIYDDITVKGTIVSVVDVAGAFFSVYTDNADGMIKIQEVAEPLSFTRFWFTEQTGPAIINGQTGTVNIEVTAGTNLSILTASFITTADVTEVKCGNVTQTSGSSVNDFTLPLTYVITDGVTERNWQVKVTVEPEIYTIATASLPASGGTASGGGEYTEGSTVTVNASANDGYEFVHWKEGESVVSETNPYSFTAAADRNLTAVFTEIFTLTVETTGTGTVKVNNVNYSGPVTAKSGTTLNLEAVAGEGFTFSGWSGDLTSTDNPLSLNIDANKNVTATFALVTGYDELRPDDSDVFPNPFSDFIRISNAKNVKRVVISDISGHQVMNIQLNGSQTIPAGNLKRGIYFINIELINGSNILRKMIKQ